MWGWTSRADGPSHRNRFSFAVFEPEEPLSPPAKMAEDSDLFSGLKNYLVGPARFVFALFRQLGFVQHHSLWCILTAFA